MKHRHPVNLCNTSHNDTDATYGGDKESRPIRNYWSMLGVETVFRGKYRLSADEHWRIFLNAWRNSINYFNNVIMGAIGACQMPSLPSQLPRSPRAQLLTSLWRPGGRQRDRLCGNAESKKRPEQEGQLKHCFNICKMSTPLHVSQFRERPCGALIITDTVLLLLREVFNLPPKPYSICFIQISCWKCQTFDA